MTRLVNELNLDMQVARRIRGLMKGDIDPRTSGAVQQWIGLCHHEPNEEALIMCAINEACGFYGVETIYNPTTTSVG